MAERKRRTADERIFEIDAKIEFHKKNIAALEAKKQAILNPKPRKVFTLNTVLKKAKEKGYTAKDIAQKLDINIED
ncbi:hypothetical protein SDC9_125040 [bioreactor metagenome]|uniref:Uncharacterized protein n=1 Tax=bioreactor metagenome TaxID=1076179 RepID=A0A645CLV0_9ZZZZ